MTGRQQGLSRESDLELREIRRAPAWALAIMVIGVAVYVALFVGAVVGTDEDQLQALTIAPILVAVTVPIALRIARSDRDRTIASIVLAAVVLKLVSAWVRYWVAFHYYGAGSSDSYDYHLTGAKLAPSYRTLDFSPSVGPLTGTGFVRLVTGVVYSIVGISPLAGFMVFGWLGFLGLVLMTRAFKIGVPTGDARRYLIIVLFYPSLLYWPSSIGKEAWMMIALGLCAYGIAGVFARRRNAFVVLALGMLAVAMVRPHLGLIVFMGFVVALLFRRAPAHSFAAPFLRIVGVGLLVIVGVVVYRQASSFLETKTQATTISGQLRDVQQGTTDGGSAFTPVTVNNPIDMIPATITVFLRPFPFEAGSVPELLSAVEGGLLVVLAIVSRNRLRSIPRLMRTTPYVTFCIGYLLAFVFAFSSFANFGILSRQRTQAIPFLLVFLALPRFRDLVADEPSPTSATGAASPPAASPAPRSRGPRPTARRRAAAIAAAAAAAPVAAERPGRRPVRTAPAQPVRTRASVPKGPSQPAAVRAPVSTGDAFAPPSRTDDPRARPSP